MLLLTTRLFTGLASRREGTVSAGSSQSGSGAVHTSVKSALSDPYYRACDVIALCLRPRVTAHASAKEAEAVCYCGFVITSLA